MSIWPLCGNSIQSCFHWGLGLLAAAAMPSTGRWAKWAS